MATKKNTNTKKNKTELHYKNTVLIVISVILLAYAGFISIFPAILTSAFNVEKFQEKMFQATSLLTSVDTVDFKIKPNFDTIITLRNWSSKYIDEQDCFDATLIQLTTTPFSIFTKNFKIKDLYLKNVKFSNQTLPTGENKLAFLPLTFNPQLFGSKKITVVSGPVRVKNLRIKNIAPHVYEEDNRMEEKYSTSEVREFLQSKPFTNVIIK